MEQVIETHDLSKILNTTHENKWVAIAPDYSRVLDAAADLAELMRRVTDSHAIFHRVLPPNVVFAPISMGYEV